MKNQCNLLPLSSSIYYETTPFFSHPSRTPGPRQGGSILAPATRGKGKGMARPTPRDYLSAIREMTTWPTLLVWGVVLWAIWLLPPLSNG